MLGFMGSLMSLLAVCTGPYWPVGAVHVSPSIKLTLFSRKLVLGKVAAKAKSVMTIFDRYSLVIKHGNGKPPSNRRLNGNIIDGGFSSKPCLTSGRQNKQCPSFYH